MPSCIHVVDQGVHLLGHRTPSRGGEWTYRNFRFAVLPCCPVQTSNGVEVQGLDEVVGYPVVADFYGCINGGFEKGVLSF